MIVHELLSRGYLQTEIAVVINVNPTCIQRIATEDMLPIIKF